MPDHPDLFSSTRANPADYLPKIHSAVDARDVATYLSSLDRTTAAPIMVTIGRATFVGARFSQTRDTLPGCRAYQEGQRTYEHAGFYLLGELPSSYRNRHADAYETESGERYYVGGYFQGAPGTPYAHLHKFGKWFQMRPVYPELRQDHIMPMIVQEVTP